MTLFLWLLLVSSGLSQSEKGKAKTVRFDVWPPEAKIHLVLPGLSKGKLGLKGSGQENVLYYPTQFSEQGKALLNIEAEGFESTTLEIDWFKMQDLSERDGFYPEKASLSGETHRAKARALFHAHPWLYGVLLALAGAGLLLALWSRRNKLTAKVQAQREEEHRKRQERGVEDRERFGPYILLNTLGKGGISYVFRAVKASDAEKKEDVALKKLQENSDEQELIRFRQEVAFLSKLSHPNIVQILDYGIVDEVCYYTMEILDGEDLESLMRNRRVGLERTARIISQAAQGLQAAHGRGIVHRDVKPGNIFVCKGDKVRLIDFGLAKDPVESIKITLKGDYAGTPRYMPPEVQAVLNREEFDLTPAYDQFALALIAFEMLTDGTPFVCNEKPEPLETKLPSLFYEKLKSVSEFKLEKAEELDLLFQRALAKNPRDRFPKITEFAQELERISKL